MTAGQEAMGKARFRIAEKAFAEAQKLRPSDRASAFGLYRAQASRIVNANESLDREGAYRLLYRLEKMPKRDAGHAELYRLALANIYVALNQTEAAKAELDAATAAKNASTKAWSMLALFEFRAKAFDLALKSFEKALALDEKMGRHDSGSAWSTRLRRSLNRRAMSWRVPLSCSAGRSHFMSWGYSAASWHLRCRLSIAECGGEGTSQGI